MVKWRYVFLGLLVFAIAPAVADAKDVLASLTQVEGSIFVKRDGRAIPVSGPTDLLRGDIILVTEESSARLVYANGCVIELEQSTVTEIADAPQCETAGKTDTQTTSDTTGESTTETNIDNSQGASSESATTNGGLSKDAALVAGGSALLLGGAALLLLSGDGGGDGDKGTSP